MWSYGYKEGWWRQTSLRKEEKKKGPWTSEKDEILSEYVRQNGETRWNSVCQVTRLRREGKSCRLRWGNHLRPNLKKFPLTNQEKQTIIQLHALYGNKWSQISQLPGRTDNNVKNYWRTKVMRQQREASRFLDIQSMGSTKSDDDLDTYSNQTFTSLLMNGARIEPFSSVPGLNAELTQHEIPYIVGDVGSEFLTWNSISCNAERYQRLSEGANGIDSNFTFEAAEKEVCNEKSDVISQTAEREVHHEKNAAGGGAILSSEHHNQPGDDDKGAGDEQEMEINLDPETIHLLDEFYATLAK